LADPARLAQLAVLDGPQPDHWKPWGISFEELRQLAETVDLKLPGFCRGYDDYRLTLLRDSPEKLLTRDNVDRIVGAVVDTCESDLTALKKTFLELCMKLKLSTDAWFREYGFFLAVVLPPSASDEQRSFWVELAMFATKILNTRVYVQPVATKAELELQLAVFMRKVIIEAVQGDNQIVYLARLAGFRIP
jgi:hypothetical protein